MRKKYVLLLLVISTISFAQDKTSFWKASSGDINAEIFENKKQLTRVQLFTLDFNRLETVLSKAPQRFNTTRSSVIVAFPNADGVLEHFRFYEFSNMDPVLAEKISEHQIVCW